MRQRKNAGREMRPKTFLSHPKRRNLFLLFPPFFLFTSLKIKMFGGRNGGLSAEKSPPPPQEESINSDTPPRSEGNHESSADKATGGQWILIPLRVSSQ